MYSMETPLTHMSRDIQMMCMLVFHQHPQNQLNMDHSQERNIGVKHYPVEFPGKSENHHTRSNIQEKYILKYRQKNRNLQIKKARHKEHTA